MQNYIYKLKNKKFIDNYLYFKKTKKYKIIVLSIIFLLFFSAFFSMLFIDVLNPKNNILTSPLYVINKNSLPLLVGIFSGIALSTAGCAMQGITRNSLAGPTTLGFLPIATLGIFVVHAIGMSNKTFLLYITSFLFSILALIINFISFRKGNSKTTKIILVGIVFGSLITSVNGILASKFIAINSSVQMWLGSTGLTYYLGNQRWEKFFYSSILIFIGFIIIQFNSKKLNIYESDPSLAISLGINVNKLYWIISIASILLSIASINLVGSIVIIGIVIPHLTRYLLSTKNYYLIIPISGIITGLIISFSIYMNALYDVGTNFYSSIISAPIFIYLIFFRKSKNDY